jgi:simple sugar transport system permease protein
MIIRLYGYDPLSAYHALFNGAFGDLYSFSESLANATPLILTALTFAIGFRGGMFNIGAEGQLYLAIPELIKGFSFLWKIGTPLIFRSKRS